VAAFLFEEVKGHVLVRFGETGHTPRWLTGLELQEDATPLCVAPYRTILGQYLRVDGPYDKNIRIEAATPEQKEEGIALHIYYDVTEVQIQSSTPTPASPA